MTDVSGETVQYTSDERPKRAPGPWLGLRRGLPFAISLLVLAWLLAPYRDAAGRALLAAALARAGASVFVVAAGFAVVSWVTDAYATARTFRHFGNPISLQETLLVRGATLIFDSINPSLGQAALALVMRRGGLSLRTSVAAVALLNTVFLLQMVLVSSVGLLADAAPVGGLSQATVLVALALAFVYSSVIALRPATLARFAAMQALFAVGLRGHAAAFAYRLPNMLVLVLGQLLFMYAFGIQVPLAAALLYLPAVMFVMGLPVSLQGLGPTQLAQVALFASYAPGDAATARAAVLAWGLGSMLLMSFGTLLVGVGCLFTRTGRRALTEVRSAGAANA